MDATRADAGPMGSHARKQKMDGKFRAARSEAYMDSPEYSKYLMKKMGEGAFLVIAALAVLIAVALPAAIAFGLWYAARDRLRRIEFAIIGAAAFGVLWARWPAGLDTYGVWLWGFGPGSADAWPPPVLPILLLAVLLGSIGAVVASSKLMNILPRFGRNKDGEDTLVPTDDERSRIDIVTTPSEAQLIDPTQHSMSLEDAATNVGAREFGIGIDRAGTPFKLTEKELGTHAILLGSTGSGKSETIKRLVGDLVLLGWDGMMLDCKEDTAEGGLRDFTESLAATRAMPYQEVALSDPDSPNWFNALQGLSPDEARDAMLAMQEFEAPHYKALNEKLLGQLVTLFYDANRVDPDRFPYPDIHAIGSMLSRPLRSATKSMRAIVLENLPGRSEEDFSWLKDTDPEVAKAAPGLGARLTSVYETEAGRTTLRPTKPTHASMDVTAGGICYIGLNSLGLPALSKMVSTAVLLRFAAYAGARSVGRNGKNKPRFLVIDEANFIDTGVLLNLMSRCRSAGIAVILCTQSPLDFDNGGSRFNADAGFSQLAQNSNVTIVMAQGDRQSAETCADALGTMDRAQMSQKMVEGEMVDEGTMSMREEYKVSPQQLTELRTGEAIVKVRVPEPKLSWVKVALFDPSQW